jgi:hypothetical protein
MSELACKLRVGSLVAMITLSGCERTRPSATPSAVPSRPVGTLQPVKTPTLSRSDAARNAVDARAGAASGPRASQERRVTSFDRNGYRHQYTPRPSAPIGLVVIGAADELWEARRLAHEARAALGLPFEDLEYKPGFGFTLSRDACTEVGYPCAPSSRHMREGPFAYLSIEHSGGYENLASEIFVVIAARGAPGSDLLLETLTKARAAFSQAFQKTTRAIWLVLRPWRSDRKAVAPEIE